MFAMYITVCIFMILTHICTSKNTVISSDMEKQHFDLQQNQVKMMDSLRTLVSLRRAGMVNVSFNVLKKQLKDLKLKLKELEQEFKNTKLSRGSGAVFTRWGREECPSSSRLIYSGNLGGSNHISYGGGASYLCMHHDPEFLKTLSGTHASLYGGEYDTGGSNFGNSDLVNGDNIPCAVCQSTRGTQKLMIPGRVTCSEGWTEQYAGYLATSYESKASAEFICMDKNPTASHGGHHNNNGALPYPVKAVCGSLPCPKYSNGKTITCVVCTR